MQVYIKLIFKQATLNICVWINFYTMDNRAQVLNVINLIGIKPKLNFLYKQSTLLFSQ